MCNVISAIECNVNCKIKNLHFVHLIRLFYYQQNLLEEFASCFLLCSVLFFGRRKKKHLQTRFDSFSFVLTTKQRLKKNAAGNCVNTTPDLLSSTYHRTIRGPLRILPIRIAPFSGARVP
jgi:hypothetical protein